MNHKKIHINPTFFYQAVGFNEVHGVGAGY
jgi:hypothetical protein